MPVELLNEFIDKNCTITLLGDEHIQLTGIIIAMEGYWIKIRENECNELYCCGHFLEIACAFCSGSVDSLKIYLFSYF